MRDMIKLNEKQLRNFWKKVDKSSDKGCWLWTACKFRGGYGCFTLNSNSLLAHRVSWFIENGDIPEYMGVVQKGLDLGSNKHSYA